MPPAADDLRRRCEKDETCDEDDVEMGVEVATTKAERCTRRSGTVWWYVAVADGTGCGAHSTNTKDKRLRTPCPRGTLRGGGGSRGADSGRQKPYRRSTVVCTVGAEFAVVVSLRCLAKHMIGSSRLK